MIAGAPDINAEYPSHLRFPRICVPRFLCNVPAQAKLMEPTNVPGGLQIRDIGIAGMSCDNCARTIERALKAHEGISEVTVDRAAGIARVSFDPTKTDIPAIHEVILRTGYHPTTRIPATPQRVT